MFAVGQSAHGELLGHLHPGGTAGTTTLTADFGGDRAASAERRVRAVTATLRPDVAVVPLPTLPSWSSSPATCTATVTDTAPATPITPGGTVSCLPAARGRSPAGSCTPTVPAPGDLLRDFHALVGGVADRHGRVRRRPSARDKRRLDPAQRHRPAHLGVGRVPDAGPGGLALVLHRNGDRHGRRHPGTPAGQVTWSSGGNGAFTPHELHVVGVGGVATCAVNYTPRRRPSHGVTACAGAATARCGSGSTQVTAVPHGSPRPRSSARPAGPGGDRRDVHGDGDRHRRRPRDHPGGSVSWTTDGAGRSVGELHVLARRVERAVVRRAR